MGQVAFSMLVLFVGFDILGLGLLVNHEVVQPIAADAFVDSAQNICAMPDVHSPSFQLTVDLIVYVQVCVTVTL